MGYFKNKLKKVAKIYQNCHLTVIKTYPERLSVFLTLPDEGYEASECTQNNQNKNSNNYFEDSNICWKGDDRGRFQIKIYFWKKYLYEVTFLINERK